MALKANLFLHIEKTEVFYIKQELPINEQIRASKVQVIDENGEKKGVMPIHDALNLAYDKKLDLVMVAQNTEVQILTPINKKKIWKVLPTICIINEVKQDTNVNLN